MRAVIILNENNNPKNYSEIKNPEDYVEIIKTISEGDIVKTIKEYLIPSNMIVYAQGPEEIRQTSPKSV